MKIKIWVSIALVTFICTLFTAFSGYAVNGSEWSISSTGTEVIATGNLWSSQSVNEPQNPVFQTSGYTSPPLGYMLIGRCSRGEDSRNRTLTYWIYAPSGTSKLRVGFFSNSDDMYIYDDFNTGSGDLFILYNITSGGNTTAPSVYTGYHSNYQFNPYYKYTSYVPFANASGDITTPIFQSEIGVSVISNNTHMDINVKPLAHHSIPYDVYLFPASLPISHGSVSNIVSSPTYVSELSASQQLQIENSPFADWLDFWQQEYNSTFGNVPVIARQIKFYAECQDTYLSTTFDPSSYNLPYSKIMSGSIEQNLLIRNDVFSSQGGVYSLDSLCIVAVAHGSFGDSVSRYDFSPTIFKYSSATAPTSTHNTITPQQQPVTDLQDLADYLKYLATVNDGNDTIRDKNFIAMLGALPWSNFVGSGVGTGLSGWLPELCSELDNTFNSIFDHWYNPSDNDLQQLINEVNIERNEIRSKLSFNTQVKTEINFVHTSILESGDTPPTFEVPLSAFWSGGSSEENVVVISFDAIPLSVVTLIKDVITVFLTLGVISYIWRTLPSTIGNMPCDKG